jgi:hypothetical protein
MLEKLRVFFDEHDAFFKKKGFSTKISDNGKRYELLKNERSVLVVYIDDNKFKFGKAFASGPLIDARDPGELAQPIAGALAEFDASFGRGEWGKLCSPSSP